MQVTSFTNEELTKFANQVKDLISDNFKVEGLNECVIIVEEKGMFGRIWNNLFPFNDNNDCRLMIFKKRR